MNLKINLTQMLMLVFMTLTVKIVSGSELVYTPQNPSFGGNVSNGQYLLGIANAQKQFERDREEETALEQFNERLQRSLLARITSVVSGDILDDDGNFVVRDFETTEFQISVVDNGNGTISITTTEKATGEQTTIQVDQNVN